MDARRVSQRANPSQSAHSTRSMIPPSANVAVTYPFVSNDLAVVRQISDTVSVMHTGRLVGGRPVETVLHRPDSDYTRELIAAMPGNRRLPHMSA